MSETDSSVGQVHEAGMTLRACMQKPGGMEPDRFLPLARSLAASVGRLHQQQRIHLDLRPERIGVSSAGDEAYVMDSGYAVQRSAEGYPYLTDGVLESGLPYCSPENTGRMHQRVDERSDLYSLGIIFYEMLAGRPPFRSDQPLEWVYMHLAQIPPSLTSLVQQLPDGLESIITKLLEKNPDKRYSSVGVLLADLDKIGRPHDIHLMEQTLHGREHEMAMLTQAFYSACLGSTEMVYVSGEAGIGKTSLIEEVLRKQQHDRDFHYITGKFEQLSKESPYHPIIQAFRGLMRHWLGQRKDQSLRWRQKLQETLGPNVQVIADIIPEAGLILASDHVPALEELQANESKKRFIYAFRKFVQALASKEHPLVLFIDDLQWADASSLQLIHALLSDPECQYVMIVCAYRPTETDPAKLPGYEPDGSMTSQALVRHIHLSQLGLAQMNQIVMETLHSPADTTRSLTELLYHQSKGNPFHFKQILLRLQDEHILGYDQEERCWKWNLGKILEQVPRYAIHELMEHKLHRLPADVRGLLQIAACVGSTFHPSLIALVLDREITDIHWSAIEAEGMIAPSEVGLYRFTHDHIQKLIYNGIDDESKQDIHIRIGQCLQGKDNIYGEHSLFDAVNHLNRGSAKMKHRQEILQLVRLNLDAGHRAKTSTAYDIALGFFAKGVELLSPEDWDREFELIFELHAQKAECEYLCGYSADSERGIDFLLDKARSPVERSRVQMIRIMQYINQGKYHESTALGLASLKEHRIDISPHPSKSLLLMEGKRIDAILGNEYGRLAFLEEMTDPERISAMNLIYAIIPSTFFTNKEVFFLLTCRAIQLTLEHGNTPASAAIYTAMGMLLGTALGKFQKGYAIAKLGVELSERYNAASIKSNTYTMFGSVLCQFAGNAREGDAYLIKALRCGMDSGDYVFASYAMGAHVNSLYTRASLSELARTIAEYMDVLDTTKDEFVRKNFYLYQQVILALQGRIPSPLSFSSPDFDEEQFLEQIRREETSATTLFQFSTYKTQISYLTGEYGEAVHWAKQAANDEAYATHLPHLPECVFYASLAIMAAPDQSQADIQQLNRHLQRFREWTKCSPENHQSHYELLQAEFARISGELHKAEAMYDQAIRTARELDDFHVTGIAGETAANYYLRCGKSKTAGYYLQLAVEGYKQWGVQLKVSQLEERIGRMRSPEDRYPVGERTLTLEDQKIAIANQTAGHMPTKRSDPNFVDSIDLAAILKTTQAITHQMTLDNVLAEIMNTIMRHAGASKGALLTGTEDSLVIQVYADSETSTFTSPSELTDSDLLPEGIIRYVFRSQEDIYYNGGEVSWLIHNPYMAQHQPQSALCIPVTVHGTMMGVLYLENKLAQHVFMPGRTAVLQTMASHGIFMCVLQSAPEPPYPLPSPGGAGEEEHDEPEAMEEALTERELEVLALLAAGLTNKEIAERLIIAIGTVKVHVKNIFAKLKVNRRINAIAQAKELRLISDNRRSVESV
ncbi:AAA family ATPase [Paenibacillus sp. SAF-054]|uniref:AAA family ATPase n=1 Tax=unclassified Paenibacillus TaxID=185978 RepID=UPI003F7D3F78